jgi:hypothetical protein
MAAPKKIVKKPLLIGFAVSPSLKRRIDAYARRKGLDRSKVIRLGVERLLALV